MEDFNLLELLRSSEGIKELQSTIEGSGISVDCPKSSFYYLDFGVCSAEDLAYEFEIPRGYEQSVTEYDRKKIERSFNIKSSYAYTIKKVEVLPANNAKIPEVTVFSNDIDILVSNSPINLNADDVINFKVEVKFNRDFIGFLGRWVIILFERKYRPSLTSCKIESFVFGIRLLGCVSRSLSSRSQLSSEARVFVPQVAIIYFEEPCIQFSFFYLSTRYPGGGHAPKLQAPTNYLTILNDIRNICRPPDDFSINYIRACRHRNLEALAQQCSVIFPKSGTATAGGSNPGSSEGDKIGGSWEPLRNPESVIRYLQSMGKITWMEEVQMTMDIAQYDMQFVVLMPIDRFNPQLTSRSVTGNPYNSPHGFSEQEKIFTCKIVVKGSSESRPRLMIGDKIRLRPMKDGLMYLNTVCPRPIAMYEMEGVILGYTLASEACLVEFVAPPREFFWGNLVEPPDGVDIWSKISYQARFTFERSGLVFCHLALAEVLNTPGLRKSLFPVDTNVPSAVMSVLNAAVVSAANTNSKNNHLSLFDPTSPSTDVQPNNNAIYGYIGDTQHGDSNVNQGTRSSGSSSITHSIFASSVDPQNQSHSFFSQFHQQSLSPTHTQISPHPGSPHSNIISGFMNLHVNASQTASSLQQESLNRLTQSSGGRSVNSNPNSLYSNNDNISSGGMDREVTTGHRKSLRQFRSMPVSTLKDEINYEAVVVEDTLENRMKSSTRSRIQQKEQNMTSRTQEFNTEQMIAIQAISHLPPPGLTNTLPPFVIFGPPGTGKTSTLIEAIIHLHRQCPQKRILVCAPSDPATDILCQRLCNHYSNTEMIRLNWWQRTQSSVPIDIISYTRQNESGIFELPSFEEMERFRIVVCTCGTAGAIGRLKPSVTNKKFDDYNFPGASSLTNPAVRKVNFDVVIIDEASQSTEAESFVPLVLCKSDGSGLMVLTGDPQQLGPMTRSNIYSIWGGPISLQERLLSLPLYRVQQSTKGDMVIFLTKNYRSHRSIISLYSRLFYNNSIEECGSPEVVNSLLKWESLPPNTEFPMLFVGVNGQHNHELDSPSFYNPEEIDEVVHICEKLLASTEVELGSEDIGVICAFRSQVLKMRTALRERGLGGINVGSVEDYQGQEMRVIIISTVLTARVPNLEVKGAIGLIGDKKRFNVAISRGMALCVVVGQPYLLCTDAYWREYLELCDKHNACVGFKCELLSRHAEEKQDEDERSLLNLTAQLSVLGSGLLDEFPRDAVSNYFNCETQWRVIL